MCVFSQVEMANEALRKSKATSHVKRSLKRKNVTFKDEQGWIGRAKKVIRMLWSGWLPDWLVSERALREEQK